MSAKRRHRRVKRGKEFNLKGSKMCNEKLFCFASRNFENIKIGYEQNLWAVATVSDRAMKSRRTKAQKYMAIGDKAILYCNTIHSFSVPFEIKSEPSLYEIVRDVWPEAWEIPFGIEPLRRPEATLQHQEATRKWPFLTDLIRRTGSISAALNMTDTTVFVPTYITRANCIEILESFDK